ncbi:NADH-quinone oxidoreductase subunit F [Hydrogenispora ethanolica]|uniref:NADH-quinone oxidoreductase subunit F n=1 Tax=Hydrogenispora ethanolica TaxID=1082276 RepID=A0A4R1R1L4_HYDET|nr:NADH-quinone oxidoreductase subunit NuoF [Hydrogenispora ethanolica]TCL59226.1 NADH-quinone oxidoreductase subunit F [Hydrogenispora ethanolica]
MIDSRQQLNELQEKWSQGYQRETARILICAGTGCVANGSLKIFEALKEEVAKQGTFVTVEMMLDGCSGTSVVKSGCHGFCEMGPLVRIEPSGVLYTKVKVEDATAIVSALVNNEEPVKHLLYHHPLTGEVYAEEGNIPFYKNQNRNVLGHCGVIDPEEIREYIAGGGYQALAKALTESSPEAVCKEVIESGLRGRGGGGFPTGRKWDATRISPGSQKYVVCNGDEGDPGAFMDRSVMEGDPHKVIEGMAIAGYAVGASEGYIYVRAEYPLAVHRLKVAVQAARELGLLGSNILGTGFAFDLKIKEGAGAFVCGEETALMASIEGKRGMPCPKPPFPAQSGLWGKPTLINNVETFANVPQIISRGAAWFRSRGTEKSPGTKTFALTGQVANTGLIEVPMGITLREIVFEIGGGLRDGKEFKAVQIGGPSGGCLTEEHLDMKLDFDSLLSVGAMIGSGGLVVTAKDTCMVEFARYFMNFTQNESCGKCVPCREGTKRLLEMLQRAVDGEGRPEDVEILEDLANAVKDASLCGLGKTAPNPVLTMLKYFKDEYLAHVVDKRCPAGVCKALLGYSINPALCKGCSKCSKVCPVQAISGEIRKPFTIDSEKCIKCGACVSSCPFKAIEEGAR